MNYAARMAEMKADEAFMKWLAAYLPEWSCVYSGVVFALHDAFKEGAAACEEMNNMSPNEQLLEEGMKATTNFHQRMAALGLVVMRAEEAAALATDKARLDHLESELSYEQRRIADGNDPGVSIFRMNVPITRELIDEQLRF